MIQIVGYQDYSVILMAQVSNQVEDLPGFANTQRCSRFIKNDHTCRKSSGPGYSNRLTLPSRHQTDYGIEIWKYDTQSGQQFARSLIHLAAAQYT
jgi:hypothetical protein